MTAVLVATEQSNFAPILPILEYYMFLYRGYLLNVYTSPVHTKEIRSGYYNEKHSRELFNLNYPQILGCVYDTVDNYTLTIITLYEGSSSVHANA